MLVDQHDEDEATEEHRFRSQKSPNCKLAIVEACRGVMLVFDVGRATHAAGSSIHPNSEMPKIIAPSKINTWWKIRPQAARTSPAASKIGQYDGFGM